MRRLLMIASALVVLALADYLYAVLYSYSKPPLIAAGGQWLRTPDWCALSVHLENVGHSPLILTGMEPMPESFDLVATLTGELAFSRPYVRPEGEVVVQPVAGGILRPSPRPDWSHPSYALRTKLPIGNRAPATVTIRYRYLGWPHVLQREAPFQGETCVPHPAQ